MHTASVLPLSTIHPEPLLHLADLSVRHCAAHLSPTFRAEPFPSHHLDPTHRSVPTPFPSDSPVRYQSSPCPTSQVIPLLVIPTTQVISPPVRPDPIRLPKPCHHLPTPSRLLQPRRLMPTSQPESLLLRAISSRRPVPDRFNFPSTPPDDSSLPVTPLPFPPRLRAATHRLPTRIDLPPHLTTSQGKPMTLEFTMRRNSADKVRRMIDDAIINSSYVPALLAADLVRKLREESPDLLAEWLDLHAEQIMRETIVKIASVTRHQVQERSRRGPSANSVFKIAVDRADGGDTDLLEGWLTQEYLAGPTNIRKRFGDMIKEEVMFTAEMYSNLARSHQMQATFLRHVAEKLGARTVSEVFSEQELARLWRSLG